MYGKFFRITDKKTNICHVKIKYQPFSYLICMNTCMRKKEEDEEGGEYYGSKKKRSQKKGLKEEEGFKAQG